jgi:hypothetical protein
MELNIIKQIKATLRAIRKAQRKSRCNPMQVVEQTEPIKPVEKAKPIAKNKTIVNIDGQELTLAQIAKRYSIKRYSNNYTVTPLPTHSRPQRTIIMRPFFSFWGRFGSCFLLP